MARLLSYAFTINLLHCLGCFLNIVFRCQIVKIVMLRNLKFKFEKKKKQKQKQNKTKTLRSMRAWQIAKILRTPHHRIKETKNWVYGVNHHHMASHVGLTDLDMLHAMSPNILFKHCQIDLVLYNAV